MGRDVADRPDLAPGAHLDRRDGHPRRIRLASGCARRAPGRCLEPAPARPRLGACSLLGADRDGHRSVDRERLRHSALSQLLAGSAVRARRDRCGSRAPAREREARYRDRARLSHRHRPLGRTLRRPRARRGRAAAGSKSRRCSGHCGEAGCNARPHPHAQPPESRVLLGPKRAQPRCRRRGDDGLRNGTADLLRHATLRCEGRRDPMRRATRG